MYKSDFYAKYCEQRMGLDTVQNVLECWNLCLISVLGTFTHILKVMRF